MSADVSSFSGHLAVPLPCPFPFTFALAAVLATTGGLFLVRFFAAAAAGLSHDAREPPMVEVRFPVLGHMVGHTVNLLRYGKRYALMMK